MGRWTSADVPDQSGRIAVVTGGSGGLGLETAAILAGRGATVVLAGRLQYTGRPVRVESSGPSHDMAAARRLWELSEQLTGVSYRILARSG